MKNTRVILRHKLQKRNNYEKVYHHRASGSNCSGRKRHAKKPAGKQDTTTVKTVITVKKTFFGSEFTGDWDNPCSGETLEQLATIKVDFKPTPKGYLVTAVMYDKTGRAVKAGSKFCEGTPQPNFQHYRLDSLMELDASCFPPLQ